MRNKLSSICVVVLITVSMPGVAYSEGSPGLSLFGGFMQGLVEGTIAREQLEAARARQELMRQQAAYYQALADAQRAQQERDQFQQRLAETIKAAWNQGFDSAIQHVRTKLPDILNQQVQDALEAYARTILAEEEPAKLCEYQRTVSGWIIQAPDRYGNRALLVLIHHRMNELGLKE